MRLPCLLLPAAAAVVQNCSSKCSEDEAASPSYITCEAASILPCTPPPSPSPACLPLLQELFETVGPLVKQKVHYDNR